MMLATPVRKSEWSSTTSTRACRVAGRAGVTRASTVAMARPRNREGGRLPRQHDLGTGSGGGDEGQRGTDPLGAFPHARHAEACGAAIAADATSIVCNRQPESNPAYSAGTHDDT